MEHSGGLNIYWMNGFMTAYLMYFTKNDIYIEKLIIFIWNYLISFDMISNF